jgi:hypothetical protein
MNIPYTFTLVRWRAPRFGLLSFGEPAPYYPSQSSSGLLPRIAHHWGVLVHKTFRYRVYPSADQVERLQRWESALRFLWNLANEQRLIGLRRPREYRRYYTDYDQAKELTELRAELPWLSDVPRGVCGQLLANLDRAWQRCFKRRSQRPRWKVKGRGKLSFSEPDPKKWRIESGLLHFPKLRPMKIGAAPPPTWQAKGVQNHPGRQPMVRLDCPRE